MSLADQCQWMVSPGIKCLRQPSKNPTDNHLFCWQHQTQRISKIVMSSPNNYTEKRSPIQTLLMQFISQPDDKDYVRDLLLNIAQFSGKIPGNINYRVHRLKENPSAFYVLSNWSTKQFLDIHIQSIKMSDELNSHTVARPTITYAHMLSVPNKSLAIGNSSTQVTLMPFFTIKTDQIDAVRRAHLSVIDSTRSEEGCIDYDLYQCDDPSVMFFYENWENQLTLTRHMNTGNFYRVVRGKVDGNLVVPWTALTMMLID